MTYIDLICSIDSLTLNVSKPKISEMGLKSLDTKVSLFKRVSSPIGRSQVHSDLRFVKYICQNLHDRIFGAKILHTKRA